MTHQLELTVQNVKCGGCVAAIQDGLNSLAGLEKVDVDIPSGKVTLSGSDLAEEEIIRKLAELGYPVA